MDTFFLVAAGLGGTFLLLQTLAGLIGFGHDGDTDVDADTDTDAGDHGHGGDWFFGVLTIRSVAAALTFFGLGGLSAGYYGADPQVAAAVAVAAGLGALYAVAAIMRSMAKLKADGTARIDRAVGLPATVYLRVPAGKGGPGKVHIQLQNRTVEYRAVTAGGELPTGAAVTVVGVVSPDTVEVVAA